MACGPVGMFNLCADLKWHFRGFLIISLLVVVWFVYFLTPVTWTVEEPKLVALHLYSYRTNYHTFKF